MGESDRFFLVFHSFRRPSLITSDLSKLKLIDAPSTGVLSDIGSNFSALFVLSKDLVVGRHEVLMVLLYC